MLSVPGMCHLSPARLSLLVTVVLGCQGQIPGGASDQAPGAKAQAGSGAGAGAAANGGRGGSAATSAGRGGAGGAADSDADAGAAMDGGTAGAAGEAGSGGAAGSDSLGGCASWQTDDMRFDSALAARYLDIHNDKRAQYCLTPLQWDDDLAAIAQTYAEMGAGNLPHNAMRNAQYAERIGCNEDCPELGENISWQEPWDFWPIDSLADDWLAEEDWEPGCNYGGSHYTQMVQQETTRVGCGAWVDDSERLHFVCNYLGWQYGGAAFPDDNCSCGGDALSPTAACP